MATTNQQGIIKKSSKSIVKVGSNSLTIEKLIEINMNRIKEVLPSVMTPERFTRIAVGATNNNPNLVDAIISNPMSFITAMMTCAQLGLEPNTPLGQSYLIPYGGKTQFQLGYQGMLDLAYRTGEYKLIDSQVVYENDDFDYELGLDPFLKHKPAKSNRGKAVYYYAVYKLINGGEGFQVMSVEDIEQHAEKYSKSYTTGPWKTDFDGMAKKTVLKKLLKYAPKKIEFGRAIASDETVKEELNKDMTTVQAEYIETDYQEHPTEDPITGEIKE